MNTEITIKEFKFRIKKMNVIELMAIRSTMNFDDVDKLQQTYNNMLERIELQVGDKWLQVKQGDDYYPAGLENDFELTQDLITFFLSYLKSVFQKSNASTAKQE